MRRTEAERLVSVVSVGPGWRAIYANTLVVGDLEQLTDEDLFWATPVAGLAHVERCLADARELDRPEPSPWDVEAELVPVTVAEGSYFGWSVADTPLALLGPGEEAPASVREEAIEAIEAARSRRERLSEGKTAAS